MKAKLLITLLTSVAASALFAAESPKVGAAAPDFSLTDANGQKHSLGENKGKWVVLEWFNPECPFVKKHYGSGNMQKLQKEYADKGVTWMSIDSSAPGNISRVSIRVVEPEERQESGESEHQEFEREYEHLRQGGYVHWTYGELLHGQQLRIKAEVRRRLRDASPAAREAFRITETTFSVPKMVVLAIREPR